MAETNQAKKWYEKAGESPDVTASTRVRLARNLRREPFPARANAAQKEKVVQEVRGALLNGNSVLSREFRFLQLEELTNEAAASLVERHIVSPGFIADRQGKAVLVSEDESIAIMINEEDHVRIQVLREGMALKEAAETADRIDTLLGENLDFAFDQEFGYLTQCPTNLGTGMRASVMLHLPALTESGGMARMGANLSKLGLTLRGAFGEGTRAVGDLYQLSNQITLGLSENQAIENLSAIAGQLMNEERRLRQEMGGSLAWQDKITRAAGTLKSARLLSGGEAAELLSLVRLGIAQGLLADVDLGTMNALSVKVQPATLMTSAGRKLSEGERDQLRAKLLREALEPLRMGE
ncbi:protein arginine kinase [Acutalibacter sp. 1XD8-33]|uniref:protein arginine kinase n=1 Tax=Acutalibacter sp. 1XD8-33 TaxID=2320081 RepID=UPI000EA2B45C|nr:protein arginine kinase [Acutalibacter sp. 1XD8-33]RKJ39425.1 protein arginine kinase [Acutalibacter sp. 1XD8-33]